MALIFPASPSENDTHTEGSITYKWDGEKWIGLGLTPVDRLVEGSNKLEIDASNNLIWTGGNVGIGVSDPDSILETVSPSTDGINAHIGGIYNDGGQSAVRRIEFGVKNYRNYIQSQQGSGGNNFSSDNSLLLNPSGGNVGIGSDNPTQPITLKRSSSGQGEFGCRFEFEDSAGPTQTSSALLVGTYGLKLKNYNSGRNFIFETGNVGIGTDSPVNRMTLDNDSAQDDEFGNVQIRYTGTTTTINSGLTAKNYTGTSQFMQWDSLGLRMGNRIVTNGGNGNVYITAGGDTVRLTINSSTGNFTGSSSADISDGRLKENITSISNATATIKQLLGKTFTWKEEAKLGTDIKYGFIAQEIKTVLPDLVYQDVGINRVSKDADKQGYGQGEIVDDYSDDYKDDSKSEWSMAVNTSGIIPVLVEAFKELEARVAALEG